MRARAGYVLKCVCNRVRVKAGWVASELESYSYII